MSAHATPEMWTPVPLPEQVLARESMAPISGTSLWFWDTGGEGPAVVLLHPGTGSGASWGYQQPVLAKAGYRVIGYSRRGHFQSAEGDPDNPGVASVDLNELVDLLGIDEFHVLGLAAGGTVATDYALSHPDRLLSLTLASTIMGVTDKSYIDLLTNLVRPSFFTSLPKDFQELGPSYRAGNPAGAAAWLKLEEEAISGKQLTQKNANAITWAAVETIRTPTLLLTGSADLYTPPSMLRLQASHLRHARVEIIEEAGHAPNWEQPDRFNAILLDFLKRH
ncbi:alpha/beta fold hydrolase [Pseudonocardia yunnanensis]|uniref:Alpha/beta fold hydrolase n=1 Tax=Pseudonocardia yunnanensis TaxID=58107 RepID=A0ABW4F4M9_9PSEU